MKKYFLIVAGVCFFMISHSQTRVYVIGTTHTEKDEINVERLENILGKIGPDVILVELDSTMLRKEKGFNFENEHLTGSMENLAMYNYQQKNQVALRPFDITNRNKFYRESGYFAKERGMFNDLHEMRKKHELSEANERYFDLAWSILDFYAESEHRTFSDINSDVCQKFTELKYTTYDIFLQICKDEPKLQKWVDFAQLQRDFWIKRNQTMVNNITHFAEEFRGKTIAVVVGYEHLYFLVNQLKKNENVVLSDWR